MAIFIAYYVEHRLIFQFRFYFQGRITQFFTSTPQKVKSSYILSHITEYSSKWKMTIWTRMQKWIIKSMEKWLFEQHSKKLIYFSKISRWVLKRTLLRFPKLKFNGDRSLSKKNIELFILLIKSLKVLIRCTEIFIFFTIVYFTETTLRYYF